MHDHPDIRYEVNRRHYAELLEQARMERLAAIGDANPELGARMARVRSALSGIQLRLERRKLGVGRAGFHGAS